MTKTNTVDTNSTFSFTNKEAAIALYLDAKKGLDAMKEEQAQHEAYMSDLCKAMLETYGTSNEDTGKKSLQLDLGDNAPRGYIVVQRDELYFIRERNSGRTPGSKNKAKISSEAPVAVAEAAPAPVPSDVTHAIEQALGQEPAQETLLQATSPSDPLANAILSVATQAIEALREHARTLPPPAFSAAE